MLSVRAEANSDVDAGVVVDVVRAAAAVARAAALAAEADRSRRRSQGAVRHRVQRSRRPARARRVASLAPRCARRGVAARRARGCTAAVRRRARLVADDGPRSAARRGPLGQHGGAGFPAERPVGRSADGTEVRGDGIGLILFGREAYLQAPLTFDRSTVNTLLNEAVIGLAGKETAIGDAIGLAIRTLEDAKVQQGRRVLVLLTDGANTAGAVEPRKAAELAAQRKVVIYPVGIGADALTVRSLFGLRQINPSADLDEGTLTAIAEG